jgi:hypothetical protein
MQKIDKTNRLSANYEKWEKDLEDNNKPHDKYTSSNHRFYYDIVMNLLYCQNGLCAYTEVSLCDEDEYKATNWINGAYHKTWRDAPYDGQLEHFDESLKSKKNDEQGKKDWLWDNLFMVETNVNLKKSTHKVNSIFKPDQPDYSPDKYLTYSKVLHKFLPKDDLSESLKQEVNAMLVILGINRRNIVKRRAKALQSYFEYGCPYDEFPTAIRFFENDL